MNKLIILLCVGAGTGCSPKSVFVAGETCTATAQCKAGLFCVAGACTDQQCQQNSECGDNHICNSAFTCVASGVAAGGSGGSAVLAITDVHGDVAAASGPEGYYTESGIVITGSGFDAGTTVQIAVKAANAVFTALTSVSVANASTITAQLPPSVAPGTFSLRVVSSAAGSIARDVTLLKGAPGADGVDGHDGAQGVPGPAGSYTAADANLVVSNTATIGLPATLDLSGALTTKAVKLPYYRCNFVAPGNLLTTFSVPSSAAPNPNKTCTATRDISNGVLGMACAPGDLLLTGGCIYDPSGPPRGINGLDVYGTDPPTQTFWCQGAVDYPPDRISIQCLSGS